MGCNVEIKARVRDLEAMRRWVEDISAEGQIALDQEDTFFRCPNGRLKLRVQTGSQDELIFYQREDSREPSESSYNITPTEYPSSLRELLASALGIIGVVKKRRLIYLVDQVRIHLDIVEGLGEFVELEVVLGADQSVQEGKTIAERLMASLGISSDDLVEGAYLDLFQDANSYREENGL